MNESTVKTLKRVTAVGILAVTFTLLGILLASKWEWTATSKAGDQHDEALKKALESSGIITAEGESPFVAVASKVKPAVVNITAKKEGRSSTEFFDFGPFQDFFPRGVHPDIPKGEIAGGSGIIIDQEGYVLTNNHVVGGSTDIMVKDTEGHEYHAEIVGTDPESDVALIKLKDAKLSNGQVAELGNSEEIKIGDWALAVGNPFGLDGTVTVGVISAKGRSNLSIAGGGPSYQSFIQTDASINFGNSGGPLVNIRGQVIGVNTAINTQGQGIGFAIPINMAKNVVEQLRASGQVTRGYLGMVPRVLDDATREALKLDRDLKGIFVDQVEDETPAQKGGLQSGDVITHVDGQPVDDPDRFRFLVAEYKPGSKIVLDVIHDGQKKKMSFELGDRSKYLASGDQAGKAPEEKIWLGLHVEPIDSPQCQRWEVDAKEGVLVTAVDFESPAQGKLQPGDVIIEINKQLVNNLSSYRKITSGLGDTKEAILFRLIREGRKTYEAVKP